MHEFGVESGRVFDVADLAKGKAVDEFHYDAVAGLVDGTGDGEAIVIENLRPGVNHLVKFHLLEPPLTDLHESILLLCGESRHVHPTSGIAVPEVIAVILDAAKGYPSEPVDLEDLLRARGIGDNVDVGFLADADLVSDGVGALAFYEGVEGEVVETAVGQAISVIWEEERHRSALDCEVGELC